MNPPESLCSAQSPAVNGVSARRCRPVSITAVVVVLLAIFAAAAGACSIPVFRYALDRWQADPFVLHVAPDDAKDEAVARFLRNFTDSTPLNLAIARPAAADASRVEFPHAEPGSGVVWSGKLDAATLERITDSPARSEIVRRTLAGESAVWVLVESGPKEAGDEVAARIEKRLRYLETASQLPAIDPNDPSSKLGPGPALGVKFSIVRVRADDPAEYFFLKMLAGPKSSGTQPAAIWLSVVFGRGRALGAWPAEDFGDEQIDEACTFLLGACSCEVKRMNPGWDLVMHAEWDEGLHAAEQARLSSPVAEGQEPPKPAESVKPETVTIRPPAPALAADAVAPQKDIIPWIAGGAFVVIAAAFLLLRRPAS